MAKVFKRSAAAWRYILLADRALPLEQQTTFVLRPLTQAEQLAVGDAIIRTSVDRGTASILSRQKQVAFDLALSNIEAVENFPIGAPKPWPKDRDARTEYLAQLSNEDVEEVGSEVYAHSKLGGDAVPVGKSSPPEHTSNSGGTSAVVETG